MPLFDAGELETWSPDQYPPHQPGAEGVCRFAPDCANGRGEGQPSYPGCPNLPAEFSERMGGPGLAGYPRYVALCRPRASSRFGPNALWATEQAASRG